VSPYIRDIQSSLSTYPNLPSGFTGPTIIKKWIDLFATKQATDDLSEQESRQLKFDIENVMNQFNEIVLGGSK
jgi:ESCRT-I complex subunit VPS28